MLRPRFLSFLVLAALTAAAFWSCDRMTGDVTENQPPVVQFVNVPLDSSQFSYAPTVYWFGYDPDGLVTAYQYRDDQSSAAVDSYRAGDGPLRAYLNALTPDSFETTENTQETIYLLTAVGDTAEHVFIVRSVDNLGLYSTPKVRTFFRTNQAPDTPEIKKTPADGWEDEQDYSDSFVVADTLLIGDEPSITWPGIQFVWKGTDPDSRDLNIIPLEFSYLLTNLSTNQVMPFPRIIDSTQVEWVYDWSDWSDAAQVVLSEAMTHGEMETGNYRLELRVQDDGKTLSDTNAVALFYAIRPTFARQLLIVDENKPLDYSRLEHRRGGYSDSLILAFYHGILPEAFELANRVRPFIDDDQDGNPDIPEPFDPTDVVWFPNKNMETSIPLDVIQQFKWVWIIDDDNPQLTDPGANNVLARQRAMGRYMNVGGQVMISGRRIFAGSYNIPVGDISLCANTFGNFFCTYFNLQTANSKGQFNVSYDIADFGGATASGALLPDVRIDSSVVCSLRFGASRYCCLPEIDFFGRSNSSSGYNYSETVYNYSSCTAELPYEMTNVDGEVLSSTPTQAILSPDIVGTLPGRRHTRILSVSRVYNVTRGVYGEVMGIRVEGTPPVWQIVVSTPVQPDESVVNYDCRVLQSDTTQAILSPDTTNTPAGFENTWIREVTRVYNVTRGVYGEVTGVVRDSLNNWEIIVSTPYDSAGWQNSDVLQVDYTYLPRWLDSDELQVDYTYIPISISQDKPIGARFVRIEGTLEVDQQTGDFLFIGQTRFRSAIFTFPFSFLDRTPVLVPGYGEATPAAAIVATQLLYFNSLRRFEVGSGDNP